MLITSSKNLLLWLTIILSSLLILSSPINASPSPSGEVLPLGTTFYLTPGAAVSYEVAPGSPHNICKLTDTTAIKPIVVFKSEGVFVIDNIIKQSDSHTYTIIGKFKSSGKGWLTVAESGSSYGKGNIVCNKV